MVIALERQKKCACELKKNFLIFRNVRSNSRVQPVLWFKLTSFSKMSLPHKVYATWRDIMENKSDPRTTNWFMMDSPLPTILMSLSYICAVKVRRASICFKWFVISEFLQFIGPRLMANRKPFDARKLQLYYNCFHLLINIYLFYEASVTGWMIGYSYRCESVNFSHTGIPMRVCEFIKLLTSFWRNAY